MVMDHRSGQDLDQSNQRYEFNSTVLQFFLLFYLKPDNTISIEFSVAEGNIIDKNLFKSCDTLDIQKYSTLVTLI